MQTRQQVLYLWLDEAALSSSVVAWALHDGCEGRGPGLPDREPPYENGAAALCDGWFLLQSPAPRLLSKGSEYETGPLLNEFVFERRVELES